MKNKTIIWLSIISFLACGVGSAYTLTHFEDYKKNLQANINITQASKYINRDFAKTKKTTCKYIEKWDYYIMEPICLRKKEYPTLWFREAVDLIRPYIQGFKEEYDYDNQTFSFDGTQPIIDTSQISIWNIYHNSPAQKKLINKLTKQNTKIKIHKKYLAKYTTQNFTFYPNKKITKKMGTCTKTNYLTSLSPLNNLYLKWWKIFNLNQAISRLPWYCTSINGNKKLPFYGGACGTAWQLFKSSLLAPQISILKRQPHIRRWANYYGKTIFGDDAAIIGMSKQLEIKNTSSFPLYFKTKNFWDYTYLAIISPTKSTTTTYIQKQPTGGLTAEVIKKTKDNYTSKIIQTQKFISRYYQYFKGWV